MRRHLRTVALTLALLPSSAPALEGPGSFFFSKKPVGDATPPKLVPDASAYSEPSTSAISALFGPTTRPAVQPVNIVALGDAIERAVRGDVAGATAAAQALNDPVARDLVEWLLIRGGSIDKDWRRISAFSRSHGHWPAPTLIQRRAEQALAKADPGPDVVLAFFSGTTPVSADGRLALASAYLAKGEQSRAAGLVREVWRTETLDEDEEKDILKRFGGLLSREDRRLRMAYRLYKEDWRSGLREAQRLGAAELALARAWAAVEKKEGNAGKLLETVPAALHEDAGYIFAQAQHHRRAERYSQAADWLLRAPRDAAALGAADEWWEERRIVGRKLLDEGDAKRAYRLVSDVAGYGPATRAEAQFHAGWIALRFLGDAATAERHFAQMAQDVTTPISRARAHYWLGRANEARGGRGDARRFYEAAARHGTTFYGQLALARLGADRLQLPSMPQPSATERAAFESNPAVRAIRLLAAAGKKELAVTFFTHLAERLESPASLALLARLTEEIGEPRYTLMVGKTAVSRGYPLEAWAYPTSGIPQFQPVGPTVDTAVIYAIARQESAFNAQAVSKAGARGLMQVMPATAKATASSYGLPFSAPRLTQDAAYNAQIGSAHLGELVGKLGGSYIMTFAAYNAGKSRVNDWVERYGDPRSPEVDPVDWIERIPFTETRNYVQRVFENMQVYRARLGGGTSRLDVERDLRRGA